jgi:cytochrome c oxidase subunit IV
VTVAHETTPKAEKQADAHAHGHGWGRYVIVWLILIAFTFLTVWTGRQNLGSANLPLALTIATIKASLVVLFFMHMSEAPGANRIVFVVSLFFALLMMLGVFGDLLTRNEMSLPSAAPSTEGPELQTGAPAAPERE